MSLGFVIWVLVMLGVCWVAYDVDRHESSK